MSAELKVRVNKLRSAGYTYGGIAKRCQISMSMVWYYIHGPKRRPEEGSQTRIVGECARCKMPAVEVFRGVKLCRMHLCGPIRDSIDNHAHNQSSMCDITTYADPGYDY